MKTYVLLIIGMMWASAAATAAILTDHAKDLSAVLAPLGFMSFPIVLIVLRWRHR